MAQLASKRKDDKNTHYVYKHVDIRTGETVYIGHGWKGRAWTNGGHSSVLRSTEHYDWLIDMNNNGFLPNDYVEIIHRGLSKKEACKIENELIRSTPTKFNKPQGIHCLKVTSEVFNKMKSLRKSGLTYNKIAEEVGLATMTVHRALNGNTKNVK